MTSADRAAQYPSADKTASLTSSLPWKTPEVKLSITRKNKYGSNIKLETEKKVEGLPEQGDSSKYN